MRRWNHIRYYLQAKPSAHRCRTPGFLRMAPVDPGQQVTELCRGDRDRAIGGPRPQKPPTLQPLGEQACPLTVVPNHFQKIAAATAEAEQVTVQRITPQHLLYLQRQACIEGEQMLHTLPIIRKRFCAIKSVD